MTPLPPKPRVEKLGTEERGIPFRWYDGLLILLFFGVALALEIVYG